MKPRFCILRTDGTNCDEETAHAVRLAEGEPVLVHVNQLRDKSAKLRDFQVLIIPGGFSYGDDVASGKILALELMSALRDEMRAFRGPILGICNGFQVLVRTGLLPFPDVGMEQGMHATLAHNASGRFQCEWVDLEVSPASTCQFTAGMQMHITLPIAHGEGRFLADGAIVGQLLADGQAPLRYAANPNGSQASIAGVCDPSGRIFGLMPHPERFVERIQFPNWRRENGREPHGLPIFKNAVSYAANL